MRRCCRWFCAYLAACWVLPLSAHELPMPDGPYAVGMLRFELSDPARRGVVSVDTAEPRVLPAYVWYPAKRGTHGTRPYLTTAEVKDQGRSMARNFAYGADELDGFDKVLAHSVEGALPANDLNTSLPAARRLRASSTEAGCPCCRGGCSR
jgi:hypothetical protein